MEIELAEPSPKYRELFLDGLEKIDSQSEKFAWVYLGETGDLELPLRDFERYVQVLKLRKTEPSPAFVADTVFWAIHDSHLVGRISIRHELNDFLKKIGGHIGYITHPSWRGKGVASEMLKQALLTERARSIGKLLLTCDAGNLASEKTIIKNGGVFSCLYEPGEGRSAKKHFWIDLTEQSSN